MRGIVAGFQRQGDRVAFYWIHWHRHPYRLEDQRAEAAQGDDIGVGTQRLFYPLLVVYDYPIDRAPGYLDAFYADVEAEAYAQVATQLSQAQREEPRITRFVRRGENTPSYRNP